MSTQQTARQTTLPTTWLGRALRLQYVNAFGEGRETSWERLVLVELVED